MRKNLNSQQHKLMIPLDWLFVSRLVGIFHLSSQLDQFTMNEW